MKKVLFLCTGNSCRSQMAEGWARQMYGDWMEVYSSGTAPQSLDRRAIQVMAECGVDISGQTSDHVDEYLGVPFDLVVTVCDSTRESCPIFPGKGKKVHRSFQDPPTLARGMASEEEALEQYRIVRDEIREFMADVKKMV
jgi:arsenate reductase